MVALINGALKPLDGFSFGCDPEVFIRNDDTGEYVGADGIIPGTKSDPYKVEKGAVQVDGMAAEFNIDPAYSFDEFNDNITTVMKELRGFLPKNHSLVLLPAVIFSEKEWEKAPDRAKELGCSPDYNAWTGSVNPPPGADALSDIDPKLRTASGHIHIGWGDNIDTSNSNHIRHCRDLVKQLDWYLGAWSSRRDADPTRRNLYGKAGACRYKPYGVEYRVLSNFWLASKTLRRMTWNRMNKAILDMRDCFIPEEAEAFGFNDLLVKSINSSKMEPALVSRYRFPVNSLNLSESY